MRKMGAVFRVLLALGVFVAIGVQFGEASVRPAKAKKAKIPCAKNLSACPEEGCGASFDPNLNRQKNIDAKDPRADVPAKVRTLTWMKKLHNPEAFESGASRDELVALGEGQKIVVVAYLLAAKAELGGESCNCGLQTPAETDNHLVLVTKDTVDKFPLPTDGSPKQGVFHSRELESVTAEFTPRVRLDHKNFTRDKIQPEIDDTEQEALLVRVTGLLLFDSEHFFRNHLVRVNNWEIHPVLTLEVCTTTTDCTATSDEGWKSLDEL